MDVSLMLTHEERCLLILPERRPIPANDAVMSNDRLEDAAVVVGFVFIVWRKDDVAALIADEVFVVRRNQKKPALSETSCAAIFRQV